MFGICSETDHFIVYNVMIACSQSAFDINSHDWSCSTSNGRMKTYLQAGSKRPEIQAIIWVDVLLASVSILGSQGKYLYLRY